MQSPNQSGIALVIVLWVIALLAVVAVSFTTATRGQANLVRNLVENAKAEALADAGVYRATLGLLEPVARQKRPVGSEMERLLERRPELEQVLLPGTEDAVRPGAEQGWRVDGTVYAWRFAGGEVLISIQDEGGKIDLNAAPDALLEGLFVSVGVEEDEASALMDAIADFRDEDDLRRLNGAEDRDYAAAALPWGAKDAPFEAIEELRQVLGMTPVLYEAVAPALTVHTGQKGIDPKSTPREVLLALPGSAAEGVDAYLAARAAAPEGAGPAFLGAAGFTARSRRRIYTIRAEARTESGAVFVREAIVRLTREPDQPFRLLAWRQGERPAARNEQAN